MRTTFIKEIASVIVLLALLVSCGVDTSTEASIGSESNNKPVVVESTTPKEAEVIVEHDGVVVSLTETKADWFSASIFLLIENNSEREVRVYTDSYSVNDYMISGSDYKDVNPGKKNIIEINIGHLQLDDYNLHTSDKYEFDYKITISDLNDKSWGMQSEELTIKMNDNTQ